MRGLLLLLLATPALAQAPTPGPPGDRTAVLGLLDKRTGESREVSLQPGETFAFGNLRGQLFTCEESEPHERPLTGAFVQLDARPRGAGGANQRWRRIFSGWMFAQSPSLNPLRHADYDVWLRSCTIRVPKGSGPVRASSAPQSPGTPSASARSPR